MFLPNSFLLFATAQRAAMPSAALQLTTLYGPMVKRDKLPLALQLAATASL